MNRENDDPMDPGRRRVDAAGWSQGATICTPKRVLVVDDDRDFADSLARLIELEGYQVDTAHDAAAARRVASRTATDVALIDIRLGETNGLDLIAEFQSDFPDITAIMITAFASVDTVISALQRGAYDYLCKPFYTEDLLATLDRCFERIALWKESENARRQLGQRNIQLEGFNRRLRNVLDGIQRLATCTQVEPLCEALLDELGTQITADEGRLFVCLGNGEALECQTLAGTKQTLGNPGKFSLDSTAPEERAGAPLQIPDGADGWTTFALVGDEGNRFGVVAFRLANGVAVTAQDYEMCQILVSFAVKAIDLLEAHGNLLTSEQRLREIIDNSPALITMRDLDDRYLMANRRFEEWHGKNRAQAVGRTSRDLFPPALAALYSASNDEVLRDEHAVEKQIESCFPDGRDRTVLLTNFPVLDAGGRPMGIGTIGTDVTARRHAEDALRHAQKMEALGQLTGGIAHDFNNLLAVISGNLSLLRDERFVGDEKLEIIEDALASVRSGADLTHRLLAFGKRQTLHPQVTDTRVLMAGMLRILERTLGEAIEIDKSLPDSLWPIEIDRGQLETALLNLALNARDAMPDGGWLRVETSNVTRERRPELGKAHLLEGDYVKVTVSDTGIGMSDDIIEQAVQPFFTTKDAKQGNGLGLSMVYGFATQSGGDLDIASTPGVGTSVALYLPRLHASGHATPDGADEAVAMTGGGERILLVEDDHRVRRMAKRTLTALGHFVLEAQDGRAALALLESSPDVDLLFTDVILSRDMNGFELATAMKKHNPNLKILYTSGYAEDPLLRGRDENEPIRLLKKPFQKEDLAREIGLALGRDRSGRSC